MVVQGQDEEEAVVVLGAAELPGAKSLVGEALDGVVLELLDDEGSTQNAGVGANGLERGINLAAVGG